MGGRIDPGVPDVVVRDAAILKGYFDRVWVPGVAFDLDPRGGALRPRLGHIRVIVITTYGSPRWFITLYVRDPGKLVLMRGLGRLLSAKAKRLYLAEYGLDRSTPESRRRFIAKVELSLRAL